MDVSQKKGGEGNRARKAEFKKMGNGAVALVFSWMKVVGLSLIFTAFFPYRAV